MSGMTSVKTMTKLTPNPESSSGHGLYSFHATGVLLFFNFCQCKINLKHPERPVGVPLDRKNKQAGIPINENRKKTIQFV